MRPRSDMSMQLRDLMIKRGFTEEFADAITNELNTDFTAGRMIGYLYQYPRLHMEDVADEMLSILELREDIIKKKELEHNQAVINDVYNNGFGAEGE